ncbi:MAG: glycosyltransferase, partial [Anaerolineae bacterium]|nr:glycosyltransferase [Anaerolineae bacterium]
NYEWWKRVAVKMTMRWADVVLLNSVHFRDFVIAYEGASPDRLIVIPNSIRLEDYSHPVDRNRLRAELGLAPNQIVLGSVGRLTYQKGFDVLLYAFSLVPRQDIVLVIAGVGEEKAALCALAAKLGLQERVRFLGYRRDVPQLMPSFDLYVHASRFEGMPIVILEAMASGCPIVATAVDGPRELIEDGVSGWLVPPEQPQLFAQAIQAALSDPAEAHRRARAARRRVAEKFNFDVVLDLWEKAFQGQVN